jgi:hypothetical protein
MYALYIWAQPYKPSLEMGNKTDHLCVSLQFLCITIHFVCRNYVQCTLLSVSCELVLNLALAPSSGHLLKIKCVDSRAYVRILADYSVLINSYGFLNNHAGLT